MKAGKSREAVTARGQRPIRRGDGARRPAKTRLSRGRASAASPLQRLVALARAEVGVRESGGNNRGARVEDYQQATWLPPGPWPWCAAFLAWLVREWTNDPAVRAALGLASDADAARWRCRDARAFGWEDWARSKGIRVLGGGPLARAGDILVFDFSHIGLVVEDQATAKQSIHTIEGNTNSSGGRDSNSGDGVWEKMRDPSLVRSLIRMLP